MVYNNILEALGNTPMLRLNHINPPTNAEVLVKFEGLNVGGSIKTRTAYQMIKAAENAGVVGPGSIIVEPTSGNQGIGLALVRLVTTQHGGSVDVADAPGGGARFSVRIPLSENAHA